MKEAIEDRKAREIVDVVIPVFGQLELARRCIESVLNSSCQTQINLIVIDDCSLDEAIPAELEKLAHEFKFSFLRNIENLGFPETCNRAFRMNPENDVLILNSDTEVYGDWLDRIIGIAHKDSSIGTVTPMTNDGEICSYPDWLQPNILDFGISGKELDDLAGVVNDGDWHQAPPVLDFVCTSREHVLIPLDFLTQRPSAKATEKRMTFVSGQ